MRVLIACSGPQNKWGNHLDVPSHLVPDRNGTAILHRTVRQVLERTSDVHVIAPVGDDRYQILGAAVHQVGPAPSEYAASRPWWNPDGRTLLLLGDVWFTEQAMGVIVSHWDEDYRAFGRYRASKLTGTPYGEIFAVSWWSAQHKALDAHLETVHATRAAGTITRPPGWMLLRAVQGVPLSRHVVRRPWWVEIDDLTDDIDTPADYERHPMFGGGHAGR